MTYPEWLSRRPSDWKPMTEQELAEAWDWSQRCGPSNNWTGTAGHGAAIVRRLLRELDEVKHDRRYKILDESAT